MNSAYTSFLNIQPGLNKCSGDHENSNEFEKSVDFDELLIERECMLSLSNLIIVNSFLRDGEQDEDVSTEIDSMLSLLTESRQNNSSSKNLPSSEILGILMRPKIVKSRIPLKDFSRSSPDFYGKRQISLKGKVIVSNEKTNSVITSKAEDNYISESL
jgi:hypothetical protein